ALDPLLDRVERRHGVGRADALGEPPVEAGAEELVAVAVVDDDVAPLHPGGLQPRDELPQHRSVRDHPRLPDRIHLDADHVARRKELPPGCQPSPTPAYGHAPCYAFGSHPFRYSLPHSASASASPTMCPVAGSTFSVWPVR